MKDNLSGRVVSGGLDNPDGLPTTLAASASRAFGGPAQPGLRGPGLAAAG